MRNRTHDVHAEDCTLYPINLVEYDEPVKRARYRHLIKPSGWDLEKNPDAKPYWSESVIDADQLERLSIDYEVLEIFEYREEHIFISLKKECYWRDYQGEPRANFEVNKNEYINLTYLNSVWLEWVVTNKALGGWTVGGQLVDYANAIRYLNTAPDYIRKRETEEKALIDAVDPDVCKDPNWPLELSEWKLSNRVRAVTPFQAKRFVKHYLNTKNT